MHIIYMDELLTSFSHCIDDADEKLINQTLIRIAVMHEIFPMESIGNSESAMKVLQKAMSAFPELVEFERERTFKNDP